MDAPLSTAVPATQSSITPAPAAFCRPSATSSTRSTRSSRPSAPTSSPAVTSRPFLEVRIRDADSLLEADEREFGSQTGGNAPAYPMLYLAEIARADGTILDLRGETGPFASYELYVPSDGEIMIVAFYDPLTKRFGSVHPILSLRLPFTLPHPTMLPVSPELRDSDGDGLADVVEFVVGTDPKKSDSDGDGLPDGVEVDQGLNPLDGLPATTGIIATARTPGTAVDVTARNDVVVVADSDRGVTVFNVFNGMDPVSIAQVDTPGTATAVALSGSENLLAVADGLEGLAIIDLADPRFASIVHQIPAADLGGGRAQAVATAGELAFVGLSSGALAAVDLPTGAVILTLDVGGENKVEDVAVEGTTVYVLTTDTLLTLPLDELGSPFFEVSGSAPAPQGPGVIPRRRLFVGGGFAYSSHANGYNVHDVSDPDHPILCAPGSTQQFGWGQIVSNGSGAGIAAVGPNSALDVLNNVSVYDLSEPCETDRFVTHFDTPGAARAVSIYNGLAFVADNNRGLQVVNYLPYDALGQPPSVEFSVEAISSALNESSVQEGSRLLIDVSVEDDVQVRNVELLQDGQVI